MNEIEEVHSEVRTLQVNIEHDIQVKPFNIGKMCDLRVVFVFDIFSDMNRANKLRRVTQIIWHGDGVSV